MAYFSRELMPYVISIYFFEKTCNHKLSTCVASYSHEQIPHVLSMNLLQSNCNHKLSTCAASYWSTSWSSSLSCKLLRCQKRFVHYSLTFIKQLSICHCHCLVKQILNPMNNWFSRAKIRLKRFLKYKRELRIKKSLKLFKL